MPSTHGVKIVKFLRTTLEISEIIRCTAMGLFNTRMEANIKAYSLMIRGMDSEYTIMQTVIDMKESLIKVNDKVMGHSSLKMEINMKENTLMINPMVSILNTVDLLSIDLLDSKVMVMAC